MEGFSFVDDHVAGMPRPTDADLDALRSRGIALLVSLTTPPVDPSALRRRGIDGLHLPVEDFRPPTLDQQRAFVAEVRARVLRGERVAVHCAAGLGRTGTMLATWLVAKGYSPAGAIDTIRTLRPGSIETEQQEASVFAWAEERDR